MNRPNPYDFVPLEAKPTLVDPTPLDRSSGLSGKLAFTITTLTPLFVHHSPGEPDRSGLHRFAHLGGHPVLPATSLKGMLRSVHEVVTNSTLGLLASRRGWYRSKVNPLAYLPGTAQKQLTPSEALFGTVGGEGTTSVGYAGRLLIDDIPLEILLERIKISRPAGGQPKPEHESFYFAPGSAGPVILGRKFYYHQQDYQRTLDVYERDRRMPVISIQAVPAQQNLRGSLRFLCLTEAELAALVYSLVLEEGLAHKLGYGKPLGLGSLQVTINQLALDAGPDGQRQRFLSYDMPDTEDWTARVAALRDAARETWRNRQGGGAASYAAFTAIARWPQDQDFVYPDFGFFRKERNQPSKTTLWQYQERRQYHPGDTAPAHVAPTLDESRVRPAADEPVERVGMFSYADDLGYFILDEADNMRCQCRSRDRKLMRRLSDMLSADEAPRVAFRRELQRGPGNQDQPVATELRLLKGDD